METEIGALLMRLIVPLLLLGALVLLLLWFLNRQRAKRRYSPLTENMLRTPAQKLEQEMEALDEKLWMGMMLVFLPATLAYASASTSIIGWMPVALAAIYGIWLLFSTLRKAIDLRLAIDGEQYTGCELNYLMRAGAWVFHDIPYQYGNIDHIVVSTGGVFTVETKAYRKPAGERESSRQATVKCDGNSLVFPHFNTSEPLEQARRHAKHTELAIRKNLGVDVRATPVVALPGWYVERSGRSDVWIMNPKRGGALAAQVKQHVISPQDAERIANYIESAVRSVPAGSKKMDPDANKYYDIWNKRRFEERKLGQ